jgi:hypothetical protein
MGNARFLVPAILLVSVAAVTLWLRASNRGQQSAASSRHVVTTAARPAVSTAAKLERIVIPLVDFEDISVAEAVNYLNAQSVTYDIPELRGIDIRIYNPQGTLAEMRVRKLKLVATPLGKVLDFLCEGRIRYVVEDEVIWLLDTSDVETFHNRRSPK